MSTNNDDFLTQLSLARYDEMFEGTGTVHNTGGPSTYMDIGEEPPISDRKQFEDHQFHAKVDLGRKRCNCKFCKKFRKSA